MNHENGVVANLSYCVPQYHVWQNVYIAAGSP